MPTGKRRKPTFTERVSLGLRVSPHIKEKLDEAAKQSGRSQSTEAAYRLEQSFERDGLLVEALTLKFSREEAGLLLAVGTTMSLSGHRQMAISKRMLASWVTHPETTAAGLLAGIALLATFLSSAGGATSLNAAEKRKALEAAEAVVQLLHQARTAKVQIAASANSPIGIIKSLLGSHGDVEEHTPMQVATALTALADGIREAASKSDKEPKP